MARVKRGVTAGRRHKKVLGKAGVEIDRKVLADIAVHDTAAFAAIAQQAKTALGIA